MPTCTYPGCENSARSSVAAYCEMHYYRIRRHGDPSVRLHQSVAPCGDVFAELTPEKAWVLGLLWSDGNMAGRGYVVSIVSKDRDLLVQAAGVLGMSSGIYQRKSGRHWTLSFGSKAVERRLIELGMTPAKSKTAIWPVGLPADLEMPFLRGVFDGDGCIYLGRWRRCRHSCSVTFYTASEPFGAGIAACLGRHHVRSSICRQRLLRVNVLDNASLRLLYTNFYQPPNCPKLDRKFAKFKQWFDCPAPRTGRPPRTT